MGKGGNPNIRLIGFKKGDPRINRKGQPKKLPKLRDLLTELLGHNDPSNLTNSELGKIFKAVVMKAKKGDSRAVDILLDRTFGKVTQAMDIKTDQPISAPIINVYSGQAPGLSKSEDKVNINKTSYEW